MTYRLAFMAVLLASNLAIAGQHGSGPGGNQGGHVSGAVGLPNYSPADATRPELSQRVVVIGKGLYFLHDKKVYEKNLETGVVRAIDDAGNAVAIFSMKGRLYGLNDSGETFLWNKVSPGTKALALVLGGDGSDWTKVGESAMQVGVVGDKLYELTKDHKVLWSDGKPKLMTSYPFQNADGTTNFGIPVSNALDTFKPTQIEGVKSISLLSGPQGATKDLELTFLGGTRRALSTVLSNEKAWEEMKTAHPRTAARP